VTEILIHPQTNTFIQCMRNLLSSFTRHRHIIHAGYTFTGNGSWILQVSLFLSFLQLSCNLIKFSSYDRTEHSRCWTFAMLSSRMKFNVLFAPIPTPSQLIYIALNWDTGRRCRIKTSRSSAKFA
jgi:hypothetical protein